MGFVGGSGNIAIATALPPSSFLYCIVNIRQFMGLLYLIFYIYLRLRFLDVETNPGWRRPVPAICRILCNNVRGLVGNLSDPSAASARYDTLFVMCRVFGTCQSCWLTGLVALSCCAVAGCLGPDWWRHTYETDAEHFANPNLSVVVAKCWFLRFMVWDRTFMCSVFTTTLTRWPDFWLFTNINGCRAGWLCVCIFPVCAWF